MTVFVHLVSMVVLVASCSRDGLSDTEAEGDLDLRQSEAMPLIVVDIMPVDLTTSIRDMDIELRVGISGRHVPEELLQDLSRRLSVSGAQEDGVTVPFEAYILPQTEEDVLGANRAIRIRPKDDLASNWHVVRIDIAGLEEVVASKRLLQSSTGTHYVRLHPDPIPTVQSLQICVDRQYPGNVGAILRFSEPVGFVPKPSTVANAPVDVSFPSGNCSMVPNISDEELDASASAFQYSCVDVNDTQAVTLHFKDLLVSAGGQEVGAFSSAHLPDSLVLDRDLGQQAGNCTFWHMP